MLPYDDFYPSPNEPIEALLDGFPFEHVPALVSYLDASGVYIRMSAAYEAWFGFSRDHLLGRHYRELLRPLGEEHFRTVDHYLQRALAGECVQYESEFADQRDSYYVRVSYTPDRDVTGRVRGVLALIQNITDLRRAEQAARANEQRYRQVVEGAPVKMWLNRPDGTPYWYNAEWRRYTGQPADLRGITLAEAIHPEDWQWYHPLREAAIAAGTPYEAKVRVRRAADGAWRWHHARLAPLREENAGGAIWAWVGVAMDVHDSAGL
jgi:two-component system, sensor histidine kinase